MQNQESEEHSPVPSPQASAAIHHYAPASHLIGFLFNTSKIFCLYKGTSECLLLMENCNYFLKHFRQLFKLLKKREKKNPPTNEEPITCIYKKQCKLFGIYRKKKCLQVHGYQTPSLVLLSKPCSYQNHQALSRKEAEQCPRCVGCRGSVLRCL